MPKGKPLSTEDRERIYDLYTSGLRQAEIAELFGITATTVSKSVSTQRKLHAGKRVEKVSEVVIGGDKRNGRLVSLGKERFEGTCLVGGKMKRRTFTASNGRNAQQQWEKWCQTLRDEQEFMDMVERKPEKPEAVCGYPLDPIEEIRPTKQDEPPTDEEVYEAQAEIDAQEERVLEATGVPLADTSEPAYLIWAKAPEPRCYGLYLTMDAALSEIDKLNEVAAFLGGGGVFEVEEVAWRG